MMRQIRKVIIHFGPHFHTREVAVEWTDDQTFGVTLGRFDLAAIQELLARAREENAPIIDETRGEWENATNPYRGN